VQPAGQPHPLADVLADFGRANSVIQKGPLQLGNQGSAASLIP
jgi:hypothetical protein